MSEIDVACILLHVTTNEISRGSLLKKTKEEFQYFVSLNVSSLARVPRVCNGKNKTNRERWNNGRFIGKNEEESVEDSLDNNEEEIMEDSLDNNGKETMEDSLNNNKEEIVEDSSDTNEEEGEKPILDFDLNEEAEYEFDLNKFPEEGEESSQAAEEFRPMIRKMLKEILPKFY